MPKRAGLGALLTCVTLAACTSTSKPGTIVVPGPSAEPSALAQPQLNLNHVHAIATGINSPNVLVATHKGMEIAAAGASPQPIGGGTLSGDVLQVMIGADGAFYASGHNLGVQVSRNGGATWAPASPDVAGLDVHGLAADPRDLRQMVAYAVGKGLFLSVDSGLHWKHKAGYADSHYLTGLAVTADGTLLAGSPELGVAASPDQGAAFVSVRDGTGPVYSMAASASSADVVLVAAGNGIFLTLNGGKDWSVGVPMSNPVTGVGIDPVDPKRFLAGDSMGGVFVSTNSGDTWSPL